MPFYEIYIMILFFISSLKKINTGLGGHYYSLNQVAKKMEGQCKIIVIGDFFPPAYQNEEDVLFFDIKKPKSLLEFLREYPWYEAVSIAHAYDLNSLGASFKVCRDLGIPLIATKAGGARAKLWHPRCDNMVVFHRGDYEYFTELNYFRPRNLEIISNRVDKPVDKSATRQDPFSMFPSGKIKILRIARIGEKYAESIVQSIALKTKLDEAGFPACLAVIGHIDNEFEMNKLKSLDLDGVVFLTSLEFTYRAAEHIPYADIIVGTGRSFIEGMAFSKLMFFPVGGEKYPCFMTKENYDFAANENFSSRIRRSNNVNPEEAFDEFKNAMDSSGARQEYSLHLEQLFLNNFYSGRGAEKLKSFYAKCDPKLNSSWIIYVWSITKIYRFFNKLKHGFRK